MNNGRVSTAIQMLEDKEKFLLAKLNLDLEMLFELMMSNDLIDNKTAPDSTRVSSGFKKYEDND